ncbi:MAG: type III-A CRISPR-associated protein Cas10/Csm1 [Candidatus Aenigmatarchaeota archaeon]
MKLNEKEINYFGALLHDIGKLIWRSQEIKAGENHEYLGDQFIRQYLGKIECLKNDIEEIAKAANRQRGKIWKADVIAAEEREDSEDKAPRRYLEAITNRVEFEGQHKKNKSKYYWYYLPQIVSLTKEKNFPINFKSSLDNFQFNESEYISHHKAILDEFIKEIELLRNETEFRAFASTFYYLLEKYTSRVLSAGYLSHPDISLFDHSRITAALSVCFEEGDEDKECLLIKGDIAGIQNYIYNGIREMTDIAKRLRGRSFTIQLLTEVISYVFIEQLNLFDANLIYNGGGHFLLLAPNNSRINDIVHNLEVKINESLLYEYAGRLSLVLEKVECGGKEFINNFRNIYLQLDNKISQRKKNKLKDSFDILFSYSIEAKEFRKKEEEIEVVEKNIGAIIPKAEYLVFSKALVPKRDKSKFEIMLFTGLEYNVYICKDEKDVEEILSYSRKNDYTKIISLNQTDFLKKLNRDIYKNIVRGFRFLGNNIPVEADGQPLSFEQLAEKYSKNYPLLGIMRMDVDNLGAVLSFGLKEVNDKEKKHTPSRVAYLSRELNWFFTGYINELAREFDIYIAYSGGDDVFVVGNWYQIIKFANKLRNELNEFVCNNDHLSASAGIIFTKPNFPISQSALLAGEQERLAKDTYPKLEKNKVGVLDIQLNWNEYEDFIQYADKLIEFLESEDGKRIIPRSFLYNLYSLTTNIFDSRGKADLRKLSKTKGILHYMFARRKVNASVIEHSNNGKSRVNELLYELALKLLLSDDKEKIYKKIKFPLTLVLYKTRR